MRRSTAVRTIAAGAALAAVTSAGVAWAGNGTSEEHGGTTPTVVNKNGHEVNEHAAEGQARAALARAHRDAAGHESAEDPTDDPATEAPEPQDEADGDTTEPPEAPEADEQGDDETGPGDDRAEQGDDQGEDADEQGDDPGENADHADDHADDHAGDHSSDDHSSDDHGEDDGGQGED